MAHDVGVLERVPLGKMGALPVSVAEAVVLKFQLGDAVLQEV